MAKMIKHLAKIKDSDARVLVVFMSLPGDEDNALVIYMDTLNDMIRDELAELIEMPEAQNEKDLGVFLKRKTLKALSPGVSILDWLHTSRKLIKIQTKNVIMTPNPGVKIPLNDIIKNMKALNESNNVSSAVVETPKVNTSLWGKNAEETKLIAENLLFEAKMLREDANLAASKKEADAKAMLDSLNPLKSEEKNIVIKTKKSKKTKTDSK
jgi:hypothetical protein